MKFHNIRQKKGDEFSTWINSFKVHKKSNHYMQFSPNGEMLLSGSADGTASIWDVRFLDKQYNKLSNNEQLNLDEEDESDSNSQKDDQKNNQ